jgi:hypothetical protein
MTYFSVVVLSRNVKIGIYITIIFPAVLYICESWSLTLRKEHRLRIFENRVLRRIFGPKRDEVTGGWRKLLNEELRNLYTSSNTNTMADEMGRACSTNRASGMHVRFWWVGQKERNH